MIMISIHVKHLDMNRHKILLKRNAMTVHQDLLRYACQYLSQTFVPMRIGIKRSWNVIVVLFLRDFLRA